MPQGKKENLSWLKKAWNVMRGREPAQTDDGTVTNKFGQKIILHRAGPAGGASGIIEFLYQPRVSELAEKMEPLLAAEKGASIVLDETTGDFYLKGKPGTPVKILGEIDLALEKELFKAAVQRVYLKIISNGINADKNPPPARARRA